MFPITEHIVKMPRHTTFFLACGRADAVPIIFLHGWPELSISWRHQLPVFAALGFRAIAPDMRGYGRSTVHPRHADYTIEHAVADMLELIDHLGAEKAVWVGHDWGNPVAWSLASHHPERCHGVGNLCVPYISAGFTPENFVPLIDRKLYPEAEYPAGQWDYMFFYVENFAAAQAAFEADVAATVHALFRKGDPAGRGKPSRSAMIRRNRGWFSGAGRAPQVVRDDDVISERDASHYIAALSRNGFFGPCSWYMNFTANAAYAKQAKNGGHIALPALFLHAAYDYICDTTGSRLAEPMRADCSDLSETVVRSGHWMAQERPVEVNAALARWLATRLPEVWTGAPPSA